MGSLGFRVRGVVLSNKWRLSARRPESRGGRIGQRSTAFDLECRACRVWYMGVYEDRGSLIYIYIPK